MFTIKSIDKTYFFITSFLFFNLFIQADNDYSKHDYLKKELKSTHIDSVQNRSQDTCKKEEKIELLLQSMQKTEQKISYLVTTVFQKIKAKLDNTQNYNHLDYRLLYADGYDEKASVDEQKSYIFNTIALGGNVGSNSGKSSSTNDVPKVSVSGDSFGNRDTRASTGSCDRGRFKNSSNVKITENTTISFGNHSKHSSGNSPEFLSHSFSSSSSSSSSDQEVTVEIARSRFEKYKQVQKEKSEKRALRLQQYGYVFEKPQALVLQLAQAQEEYKKACKHYKDMWKIIGWAAKDAAEIEIIEIETKILQAQDLFEQQALQQIEQKEKKEVETGAAFLAEYGYEIEIANAWVEKLQNAQHDLQKAEQRCKNVYFFAWPQDAFNRDQNQEKLKNIEQIIFNARLSRQREIISQLQEVLAMQDHLPKKVAVDTKACDQFKKKLLLALVLASRKDLAVTIDQDIVCKDDFSNKDQQKKLGEDFRLYSVPIAYITSNVFAQALSQAVYLTDKDKKGVLFRAQFVNPVMQLQKEMRNMQQNNQNDVFKGMNEEQKYEKVYADLQEGLRQLRKLGNSLLDPILEQTVTAVISYGYIEDQRVLTFIDDAGKARHFVFSEKSYRLPREIVLDDSYIWRNNIEKQIQKSDQTYDKQSQKAQAYLEKLSKQSDVIEQKLIKKGIKSLDDQLPQNFQAACNAKGKPLRDETGAYFNTKGEKCVWNAEKNYWDTTTLNGSHLHQKPSVPNIVAQTDADTRSEKDATIHDHPQVDDVQTGQGCAIPVPKQEKQEQQGCGDTNSVDRPTHTGHTPVENAVEKNIGCGGNVEGLESPTIFQGKKDKDKAKNEAKPAQVEPKKGTPEWDKKYPYGKYEGADYHTEKGSNRKSPCPKNGQAALDRSVKVPDTDHRVTIEDGKIVILRHEGNGIYHGYLVENYHLIKDYKIRNVLVDAGLVKDGKSGKIVK